MNDIVIEDIKYIIKNIELNYFEGRVFLITGANGFLGTYIINVLLYLNKYILKDKCKIVALCRNQKAAYDKFNKYIDNEYFEFIIQNIEMEIQYKGEIDYIIHAASRANTKEFAINPVGVLSANTIGTYNLLQYAKSKEIKGFLFFSSGAIYGNANKSNKSIKEDQYFPIDPLDIRSCYSESKKMGENMCYCFFKQFSVPTKIVRIAHTYGPGINLNDGRVFSDFVNNILNNKDLVISSDGEAKRPFCYIADAVIAFFLILFNGNSGEAYNMANNNCFVSINELANILTTKAFKDKNLKIVYEKSGNLQSNNKGEVSIDTSKLYNMGWNPIINIEEGFKRTVTSFLEGEKNGRL